MSRVSDSVVGVWPNHFIFNRCPGNADIATDAGKEGEGCQNRQGAAGSVRRQLVRGETEKGP